MGDIDTQRELLESHSPANFAASVSVPVLLIHAEDDDNVNIAQSERMDEALREAGKDVKFVRLLEGGHDLRKGKATERALRESVLFFSKHL